MKNSPGNPGLFFFTDVKEIKLCKLCCEDFI
jgi:hypothetical protein